MAFDFSFMFEVFFKIIEKMPVNAELMLLPFFFGLLIAVFFTILREKESRLTPLIKGYIAFARGTPALVQIFIVFYGLPILVTLIAGSLGVEFKPDNISARTLCIIALTYNASAYLSETLRGGVASVGSGEVDAARSIGMTEMQIIRHIILPQSMLICLPQFCVQMVSILQNTVLVYFVSYVEMNSEGSILAQENWLYFEAFMAVGLAFWVMTFFIELVFHVLERKFLYGKFKRL
jgi:His/Glu/Gln/Arg/opine family amino acid ABC transporter permease subunit